MSAMTSAPVSALTSPTTGFMSAYDYTATKARDGRRGGVRLRTSTARLGRSPSRGRIHESMAHTGGPTTREDGGGVGDFFWSFPGRDRRVMWRGLRVDAYRAIIGDSGSWEEGSLLVWLVSDVLSGLEVVVLDIKLASLRESVRCSTSGAAPNRGGSKYPKSESRLGADWTIKSRSRLLPRQGPAPGPAFLLWQRPESDVELVPPYLPVRSVLTCRQDLSDRVHGAFQAGDCPRQQRTSEK